MCEDQDRRIADSALFLQTSWYLPMEAEQRTHEVTLLLRDWYGSGKPGTITAFAQDRQPSGEDWKTAPCRVQRLFFEPE
jgi:hypothetical protein